jgi:hypothetical protein
MTPTGAKAREGKARYQGICRGADTADFDSELAMLLGPKRGSTRQRAPQPLAHLT